MKKTKRLGRGLEDIAHYFVSQNQANTSEHSILNESSVQNRYKSVSIVDISDPQRGASLCAKVGIELSQKGIKVLLIDADSRFPGISFMLGLSLHGFSIDHYYQERYEPSDIVYTGPYGVRLLAPHLTIEDVSFKSNSKKSLMLDVLKLIETETDIVIIRQFEDYINPVIDEALFVVPALTASLINSYKEIKKFITADDRKMAGVLVSGAGKGHTAIDVYEKICRCTEMSYGTRPHFLGSLNAEEVGDSAFDSSSVENIVSHLTDIALKNREIKGRKRLFFERLRNLACSDEISPMEKEYLAEVILNINQ